MEKTGIMPNGVTRYFTYDVNGPAEAEYVMKSILGTRVGPEAAVVSDTFSKHHELFQDSSIITRGHGAARFTIYDTTQVWTLDIEQRTSSHRFFALIYLLPKDNLVEGKFKEKNGNLINIVDVVGHTVSRLAFKDRNFIHFILY